MCGNPACGFHVHMGKASYMLSALPTQAFSASLTRQYYFMFAVIPKKEDLILTGSLYAATT